MKMLAICCGALTCMLASTTVAAQVTTSQYDNLRTGATLNEKTLTPQNVNAKQFGKLGAFQVDGAVYAQPLFIPALEIPGKGRHDVLFIATEHDSVYAFDAERPVTRPCGKSISPTLSAASLQFLLATCSAHSSGRKSASLPRP
jgi:hypothetical protein